MTVSRRALIRTAATAAGGAFLGARPAAPAVNAPHRPGQPCAVAVGDVLSLPEFEEQARRCMSTMVYEFVASGAADEHTLRWNRGAYDRLRLRPRVLRDVTNIDMRVSLFGRELPFPILLAPTAYHRTIHPDGEIATARGAGAAHATWVVSSSTTTLIEDIAAVARAPLWFQLYLQRDRGLTQDLVQRVEQAGCQALCLTVDQPVLGARNRQTRAKFRLPPGVTAPYRMDIGQGKDILDPRRVVVTWKDVEWLRSVTRVPLLLKGILAAEDADQALQVGAQGIIVSNHGARILDTAPATIDALPEVAERVAGRAPVLVDGGIRRGTDVIKAIALGATAVLIGRPYCYGLAVGGADGVQRAVEILRTELEMAMMLTGRPSLRDIDRSVLWLSTPCAG
jgi:4-hydroxymandelate oxidase